MYLPISRRSMRSQQERGRELGLGLLGFRSPVAPAPAPALTLTLTLTLTLAITLTPGTGARRHGADEGLVYEWLPVAARGGV